MANASPIFFEGPAGPGLKMGGRETRVRKFRGHPRGEGERERNNWGRHAPSERSRRAALGHEPANSPRHLSQRFNVAHCEHLLQISGEQKIERPTGHHAQLFRQAWQFNGPLLSRRRSDVPDFILREEPFTAFRNKFLEGCDILLEFLPSAHGIFPCSFSAKLNFRTQLFTILVDQRKKLCFSELRLKYLPNS